MQGRDELNQTQYSNPGQQKIVRNREKLLFPSDLAPSKELSETGCGINLEPMLPKNIEGKQYNNSYIFVKKNV